jgi:hypothetical protein
MTRTEPARQPRGAPSVPTYTCEARRYDARTSSASSPERSQLTDRLVVKAVLAHQRQLAINETLAHIAYLRWSGVVERRTRSDGVYEWYATGDAPLEVAGLSGSR